GPTNRHSGETGGAPGELANAEVRALVSDALDELPLPAEESEARLDFHHDGRRLRERLDDCDAGCELKAPCRESRGRLSAPRLVGRELVGEQSCPQHEEARAPGARQ